MSFFRCGHSVVFSFLGVYIYQYPHRRQLTACPMSSGHRVKEGKEGQGLFLRPCLSRNIHASTLMRSGSVGHPASFSVVGLQTPLFPLFLPRSGNRSSSSSCTPAAFGDLMGTHSSQNVVSLSAAYDLFRTVRWSCVSLRSVLSLMDSSAV